MASTWRKLRLRRSSPHPSTSRCTLAAQKLQPFTGQLDVWCTGSGMQPSKPSNNRKNICSAQGLKQCFKDGDALPMSMTACSRASRCSGGSKLLLPIALPRTIIDPWVTYGYLPRRISNILPNGSSWSRESQEMSMNEHERSTCKLNQKYSKIIKMDENLNFWCLKLPFGTVGRITASASTVRLACCDICWVFLSQSLDYSMPNGITFFCIMA